MSKFLVGAGTVILVLWVLNQNKGIYGMGPGLTGGQNVSFATGGDPSNPAAPFATAAGTTPATAPGSSPIAGCGCGSGPYLGKGSTY